LELGYWNLMTVIVFIIVLAILIFVHELGHFLAARLFGVRVDAFKIGFGPKLWAWRPKRRGPDGSVTAGETEYGVNAIPFGGYVKIFGEDPNDENTNGPDAGRSFVHKARWKQAIILASGVLMNIIFAWVLYVSAFATGVTASTDGFEQYAADFHDPRIMVVYVTPGSPAEKAGIKEGDVIAAVGTSTAMTGLNSRPAGGALTVQDIQAAVNASAGTPVSFGLVRAGTTTEVAVAPVAGIVAGEYAVGISMDDIVDMKLPFWASVKEGVSYTLVVLHDTVAGLYGLVANIFRGAPDFSDVAGPVGIAGIVGSAARTGMSSLLMIVAVISVNLAVINLVPFPALDGGRILFVAIETVIRRRISPRVANMLNTVGFALLIALMIAVTWKDVARLVG